MEKPPVRGPLCTRATLAAELRALGVRPGETLLVHSSLSALGWVAGGAVDVVHALLDVLGEDGTLVVPTHSGDNSDPAHWSSPAVPEEWWPELRASMPGYDPHTTRSFGVGTVPEVVRTWPGALRSGHPQTSFAALGPLAGRITSGHRPECRLGEHSPLARLEEAGARILLLGAGFDSCTAFHLAEYRVPGAEDRVEVGFAALTAGGGRAWVTVLDSPISSDDFELLGADYERDRPVPRGPVGAATCRLFPLTEAVAYAGRWLPVHRPPA
ncbi:aminoglycoside N(3)-acetyltransferase [Streptomyces sp. NPDC058045]|uniref:aminoglycoside N(3)-acetyltransferase n=1 Tax=Streptomyces sp. NPDC058045 TaxID=3346311 RepID=UPI0036F01D3C